MSDQDILRVVIVEDHPLFRRGLHQLAEMSPDIAIVGESDNGAGAAALVETLRPDLVLLDLNMPGMSGLETLASLKRLDVDTRVVILTVSNAVDDVVAALRGGADGYLLKDMDPVDLLEKLREVADDKVVLSPDIALCLARALQAEGKRDQEPGIADLTEREREVLFYIRDGESNKLIARHMGITEATVKVHVKHLLRKLGLRSRVEAAVWAAKITLPDASKTQLGGARNFVSPR